MKHTLRSKVIADIEPFLADGVVPPAALGIALKGIHTKIVDEAINGLQPNRVLGGVPLLIDPSELFLP